LPSDCSGNSRTESLSSQLDHKLDISLVINNQVASSGEEIVIPIMIENPFNLKSFGFELYFPSNILQFLALQRADLLEDFIQVDAHEIASGVLRVGGYSATPIKTDSSGIMLVLIFSAIDEIKTLNSLSIGSTFDGIQNDEPTGGKLPTKKKKLFFL